MITLEYSRLQYKPAVTEEELIYIGLATHLYDNNNNLDLRKVEIVEDKKRLYTFNDELDKNVINIILSRIKNEWEENNLFTAQKSYATFNEFTRRYVSNFNFSPIEKMNFNTVEDAEKFISDTSRYILNYSIDKSDRMSRQEKEDYLNAVFSAKYENVNKHKQVEANSTEDKITFDFVIQDTYSNKNVYIKKLNVNNQTINTVRSYAAFSTFNDVDIISSVANNHKHLPRSVNNYINRSKNILVSEEHVIEEVSKFLSKHKNIDVLV